MAVVALVLIVLWIGIVAVLRSVVQARRTGGVAAPPPVERRSPRALARFLSSLGVILVVAAPAAELLGFPPIGSFDHDAVRWAGVGLTLLGIAWTWMAQSAMGTSWLPDVDPSKPTPLVTGGPFGIVRNPVLLGTMVSVVGLALVVPNVLSLAAVLTVIVSLNLQVRLVEEPFLEDRHGEAYRAYQRNVGRFVPGIGRRR